MAKLFFRYGAMGSSKTAHALMVHYNYQERETRNRKALLLKPELENRDGTNVLKSRIGLQAEVETVESFISRTYNRKPVDLAAEISAIIIDEAQFLTESQVDFFAGMVDTCVIPVICYGLRTDFTGHFFQGSKRLMELADEIEEIPTVCWCGRKARFSARVQDGKVVRTGAQVQMGGNESYISLCRKHYQQGQLGPERTGGIHE
ncbi:MAG: thymidine kinase [Clostridiales bacterium]|nr:thymidine kinase [Clostridiales bacterium]